MSVVCEINDWHAHYSRAENVYMHEYFICFLLTLRMYDFVPVRVLFIVRIILIPIRLYTLQHHCEHVAQTNRDGYQFGLS